jgi:hypothetical protein
MDDNLIEDEKEPKLLVTRKKNTFKAVPLDP